MEITNKKNLMRQSIICFFVGLLFVILGLIVITKGSNSPNGVSIGKFSNVDLDNLVGGMEISCMGLFFSILNLSHLFSKEKNKNLYLVKIERGLYKFLDDEGYSYFITNKSLDLQEKKYYNVSLIHKTIMKINESNVEPFPLHYERVSYWVGTYSPFMKDEVSIFLPVLYIMSIPFIFSLIYYKSFSNLYYRFFAIFSFIAFFLIIYDLIYKIRLQKKYKLMAQINSKNEMNNKNVNIDIEQNFKNNDVKIDNIFEKIYAIFLALIFIAIGFFIMRIEIDGGQPMFIYLIKGVFLCALFVGILNVLKPFFKDDNIELFYKFKKISYYIYIVLFLTFVIFMLFIFIKGN